eukprot:CAMPEP_0202827442 /NCGR_PEP_ID=MMETSP1389-20130828/14269_1 /ASSEMBLY_ACC=CAM_ASM_000865 /TAXON_ID=302021 /ORGANISM="Rhodomonas sp., Strain CCMP768" /LENGTH=422 /DNA_ID=CAMNT_0049500835 /DNA_START=20 /DNA_END=1288 /DNA_ORIENTATION=+
MPVTPRPATKRYRFPSLSRWRLKVSMAKSMNLQTWLLLGMAREARDGQRESDRMRELLVMLLCLSGGVSVTAAYKALPRRQSTTEGAIHDVDFYDNMTFYEQFRFEKPQFWQVLSAMQWLRADGAPRVMAIGKEKHRMWVRTDHIFMVFLRRLSYPARWNNLKKILGGSRASLSQIYNWALRYIYSVFCPLVEDIHIWKHRFPMFARRLSDMGAAFDNLIAFFDGHFDPTARPSGDGAIHPTLKDYQTYSFLHSAHGFMYQAAILPNGMSLCWGPYLGKDHDAKTYLWTDILTDLMNIAEELNRVFSLFADSAYPRSRFMQVILKANPGGQLSRAERRYNVLMQRFRIVIENLFSEVTTYWHTLQLATNKKIGKQDIARMFPCCVWLHNVRTIFAGNQTSAYFGHDLIAQESLEQYLSYAFS